MRWPAMLGALLSFALASSASAEEAFVGRWAVSPQVCGASSGDGARSTALVATATTLAWFDGPCKIGKMYKVRAMHLQAHCGKGDVPVTLDAMGDRMRVTWDRTVEELKRCK